MPSAFAPIRKDNNVKILIDGENYFKHLAQQLKLAEKEIFIADWWISPKLHLVRPVCLDEEDKYLENRVDMLLKSAVILLIINLFIG